MLFSILLVIASQLDGEAHPHLVYVQITDPPLFGPSVRKTTAIEMFVSSYDLTRSEAELAHFLALGGTLEEEAERRGVSRNTAKSQLHSIFAKTETNRQSELVSLLLRSVAGINLRAG